MKKYPKAKPVLVRWVDSTATNGWNVKPGAAMECVTIGHLLKKTRKRVAVCMNRCVHGDGEIIEIPTCAVKSIKRL